jgi:hypothetical protein
LNCAHQRVEHKPGAEGHQCLNKPENGFKKSSFDTVVFRAEKRKLELRT